MRAMYLLEILPLMKDGDIADCTNRDFLGIKKERGTFYFYDSRSETLTTEKMSINNTFMKQSFKIRPKFISWQEAFQDLKDGYTIRGYESEEMDSYYDLADTDTTMSLAEEFPSLDIATLFQLKWVSMKEEK
jgi:hypothetical protein